MRMLRNTTYICIRERKREWVYGMWMGTGMGFGGVDWFIIFFLISLEKNSLFSFYVKYILSIFNFISALKLCQKFFFLFFSSLSRFFILLIYLYFLLLLLWIMLLAFLITVYRLLLFTNYNLHFYFFCHTLFLRCCKLLFKTNRIQAKYLSELYTEKLFT